MIWILLAALGVPLWLLAGGVLVTFWWRWQFRRQPGVFACRLQPAGSTEGSSRWPHGKQYAYWAHDVLLVHRGLGLRRYEALPVSSVVGPIQAIDVKGLGPRPMSWQLHLDDGRLVDMAAEAQVVTTANGPFVAASMR